MTELRTLKTLLSSLNKAHIRHRDIVKFFPLLEAIEGVKVEKIGESFEGRSISCVSVGTGPIVILAWTQMHGDEASATAAVFDLLTSLLENTDNALNNWQATFSLHIVPMLNPDGAQRQIRQNAQGIDINRDALSLQSPEGRLLLNLVTEIKPNIAFNLHDQSPYYQCGDYGTPASIAFLAPAFNVSKSIDASRQKAMELIVVMNKRLQKDIPNCVARYNDSYSARSFGDNIAGLGTSTILIESGSAPNDPNRQVARTMNVVAIKAAMEYVLNEASQTPPNINEYFAIPENVENALSSLLIKNLFFVQGKYKADVSIKQSARYSNEYYVDFIGDAGIQAGLVQLDASELEYVAGKVYTLESQINLDLDTYIDLLKSGFLFFNDPHTLLSNNSGLDILFGSTTSSTAGLAINQQAYFLLAKRSKPAQVSHAVLNGKLVDLEKLSE